MITMRPGYETLDYRAPRLEQAAAIDAGIAASHPHLREQIAASYPAGRELRRLRRQADADPGSRCGAASSSCSSSAADHG